MKHKTNIQTKVVLHVLVFVAFLNLTYNITYAKTGLAEELTHVFGERNFEQKYDIHSGSFLLKELYNDKEKKLQRAINIIDVNLQDPFTKVELSMPDSMNTLQTTSRQANLRSQEGYLVRGAINGSFINNRMPMNLITQNNKIVNYRNYGPTSIVESSPIFQQVAFGLDKNQKPLIEFYDNSIQVKLNNNLNLPVYTINNQRYENQVVLYTPNHLQNQTGTNQWGTEIVVTNSSKDPKELSFGDTITGTASKITRFGEGANSNIPQNGFVISAHGNGLSEQLKHVNVGDKVTLTASVDQKWQDAKFMMASGPMLVRGGKVSISMNANSLFALERAPRTAVATTKDSNKLLFITLDGRQDGYSNGATIREFAEYLVSIGVENAMNLDGGGATTMVIRPKEEGVLRFANKPSDSSGERGVSTSLQIVDVSPAKQINQPMLTIDSLDSVSKWIVTTARASANLKKNTAYEPVRQGHGSIKLSYDFTQGEQGTAAAYLTPTFPRALDGRPIKLGVWVYGDRNKNWLRGTIIDVKGQRHVVDFTAQGGLDWRGWRYETASIPSNIAYPVALEQIYIAQPTIALQGKGTIFFDQLEAIYQLSYRVERFKDVPISYWARHEIIELNNLHVIAGYLDGSFKPDINITRDQAAIMLVRELNLEKKATYKNSFQDVPKDLYSYSDIMAATEAGLMFGKGDGKFEPHAYLTRAEMAAILQRAYNLQGENHINFKDVASSHWAYKTIQAVSASGVTVGYDDQTFRPSKPTTRAEFSVFLYRAINYKR